MDDIANILSNKDFSMPREVSAIKSFVAQEYNKDIEVAIRNDEIVISSRSVGLISSLRMNSPSLVKAASTNKKIRFKVG